LSRNHSSIGGDGDIEGSPGEGEALGGTVLGVGAYGATEEFQPVWLANFDRMIATRTPVRLDSEMCQAQIQPDASFSLSV